MNPGEFRVASSYLSSFIASYSQHAEDRPIIPNVKPGFLRNELPTEMPSGGEEFAKIMSDFEKKILSGLVNWAHPHFYGYCPSGRSYPSILGEMLATGYGAMGFSKRSNQGLTELEIFALDLFAEILNLPAALSFRETDGKGGGSFQNSSSECVFNSMLVARNQAIGLLNRQTGKPKYHIMGRLVAYCSSEAHFCVEKAAQILVVHLRRIEVNERDNAMRAGDLEQAIREDQKNGYYPFFVCATFGTSGIGAVDDLAGISKLASKYKLWYHVDAAYAGHALMLPQFRKYVTSLSNVDSLNISPYKWSLVNIDGAALYVKSRKLFSDTFYEEPRYNEYLEWSDIDLCMQGIPHYRRFRALKLYFTMRMYGKRLLQSYVENHIILAQRMASLLEKDDLFQVEVKSLFGLVCFRMNDAPGQDTNYLTAELLGRINEQGNLYVTPHKIRGIVLIRFSVNSEFSTQDKIDVAYKHIRAQANDLLLNIKYSSRDPILSMVLYVNKARLEEFEAKHKHRDYDCIFLPENKEHPHTSSRLDEEDLLLTNEEKEEDPILQSEGEKEEDPHILSDKGEAQEEDNNEGQNNNEFEPE